MGVGGRYLSGLLGEVSGGREEEGRVQSLCSLDAARQVRPAC